MVRFENKSNKFGDNLLYSAIKKGERRELNPRMLESQPSALTTWLRSPIL